MMMRWVKWRRVPQVESASSEMSGYSSVGLQITSLSVTWCKRFNVDVVTHTTLYLYVCVMLLCRVTMSNGVYHLHKLRMIALPSSGRQQQHAMIYTRLLERWEHLYRKCSVVSGPPTVSRDIIMQDCIYNIISLLFAVTRR